MEEASLPPVELWPDHEEVVEVFSNLGTQWLAGMGGATGLNYASIPFVLQMVGIPKKRWPVLFQDLKVMEHAALTQMHKKQ